MALIALIKTILQIDNNSSDSNNNIKSLEGHEILISITELINKIYELKTYNKVINDLIYGRQ